MNIRFAVIGAGYIGCRHLEMIDRCAGAEAVGFVEINETRRLSAEKKFGVRGFETIDALFDETLDIQVVNICTPNGLHVAQAVDVLKRRANVIVEKPLGLTAESCRELAEAGRKAGRYIFGVMQNRYSPSAQWLKQIIDEKRLGKIVSAQINCFWNRDDRYYAQSDWKGTKAMDGGVIFTQFSHFIDILYWSLGEISVLSATMDNFTHKKNTEFADSGAVVFRLKDGGIGTFQFSTSVWDKNQESSLMLVGEKGSLKIGGQYMNAVEYCHIQDYAPPVLPPPSPPNDYGGYQGSAANHFAVIQNAVETLNGRAQPDATAEQGLKVVEIIEAMYKAASFS